MRREARLGGARGALLAGLLAMAGSAWAEPRPVRVVLQSTRPQDVARYLAAPVRPLFPVGATRRPVTAHRLDGWHLCELPDGADGPAAARALVAQGLATHAEVDGEIRASAQPADPFATSLSSWGQLYGDQWGLGALSLPAAWDLARGDPAIIVAVVDSGTDFLHPDLVSARWRNPLEVPDNGIDDDGNGYVDDVFGYDFASGQGGRDADPSDALGHGTLVGGVAAADTDSGVGVAGACWGCRLMSLKALDDTGSGYVSDAAEAMGYALDQGARVLNLSFTTSGTSALLESLVGLARQGGAVVVASAGNFGGDVEEVAPANIDDALTVAAMSVAGTIPSWSNAGATVDLAAPGVDILGPRALATDFLQTGTAVVETDYYRASGTSFAAAAVAGVAALVLSADPSLSSDQVINVLRAGAVDLGATGSDGRSGWGRADARRALERVRAMTARIDTPRFRQLFSFGATLTVAGTAAGTDLATWQLSLGSGTFPSSFVPLTAPSSAPVVAATMASIPSATLADGTYTLRLRATSVDGVTYEDRRLIVVDNSRGRVSGTVAWQVDGSPATGVNVWAMDPATQSFVAQARMVGGSFDFADGLPAGSYVLFADGTYSEFLSEYWRDASTFATATAVQVVPQGVVTGIDIALARRGRVEGTVRDEVGVPLPGQLVELLYQATGGVAGAAYSGGGGSYQFQRLPAGSFYVRARGADGSHRVEYWQEAGNVGQAVAIATANDTTVDAIDFSLAQETGSIAGVVRDLFGNPLTSFPVEVAPQNGRFLRSTTTDAAGAFGVDRLPPGSFLVRTGDQNEYEQQYYDRATDRVGAIRIHLLEGGTFGSADLVLGSTWFEDVTGASGRLAGDESFDSLGVVAALLDGDDRPDLYVVNQVGPDSYLLGDGAFGFTDETAARGAGAADLKAQAVVFDLENDGDADLFVPKYGRFGAGSVNLLLRNEGNRFVDQTFVAGVVDARIGTDAAVGDYDGDGYPDLYLVNNFETNVLYRNDGDRTFTDVTAMSGAGGSAGNNTQAATFMDVDGDGDLDLFVTASEFPGAGRGNLLFVNQGDGTFLEEGQARGVELPAGSYNAAFGDVDGDGDADLFVASSYGGVLYGNDGLGRFSDITAAWGLAGVTASSGCSFGDLDDDGDLDLVIADFQGGIRMLVNDGAAFRDLTHVSGVVRGGQSRYLALVDLDVDGRLDLVLTHDYAGNRVYRNRTPRRRWLEVRLHGRRSNREGIGARITVAAPGATQTRFAGLGDAGDKASPIAHFGLGSASMANVTVRWPSGIVQVNVAVAVDRLLHVYEPEPEAIVTAPGPGPTNQPRVRLFGGLGEPWPVAFDAYGSSGFGASVAAGELALQAGVGQDVAVMAGEGPTLGPHVRVFDDHGSPVAGASFYAYGTLRYGGAIAVARGLSSPTDLALTGPGPGAAFAPHVRGFGATGAAQPGLSFIAFPGLGHGVRPGSYDEDGDGRDEVVAAAGPGPAYTAHVRLFRFDGAVSPVPGGSFWAFTGPAAGARAAGRDGALVVAPGPSPLQAAAVRGFARAGGLLVPLPGYDVVVFPGAAYGASVALAQLDGAGYPEAIVAPGASPALAAHVRAVGYDGGSAVLLARPSFLAYDPAVRYGGSVAALEPGP